MDWITGIQKAIDYIEDHITKKIDYEEISKRAYSSSFHFQRVFSIMCGITLGEYIRSRRLSLAGNELLESNEKIINIANCQNPRCITSIEKDLDQVFVLTDKENKVYRCQYCEMSLK